MFCKNNSILIQTSYTFPVADTPARYLERRSTNKAAAQKRFAVQVSDTPMTPKDPTFVPHPTPKGGQDS
jgi:hypothetical protein